ncbi:HTH_Tnp_Tc3_2 domain-containing protein [Trichonephila clavipes]|nr:HTH_Tnp_Tc3_2 domain-containing protein [Trichonephila clavipes]
MPHRKLRAHYKQLSEFEKDDIIGLKEAGWANRRIAHHMGRSHAAIRRCWHVHHGHSKTADRAKFTLVLTATPPAHCRARLQWCLLRSGCDQADWGRIVFSDESHFQLCLDNHRRRVWRRLGQRADPAFTIAGPTSPQPGVIYIVWDTISFDSRLDAHLQHSGTWTTF